MMLAYDWNYEAPQPEISRLYEKSKGLMWNATGDLPWETVVDPEAENQPDVFNPIFGSNVWKRLDKRTEIPRLRHHVTAYMFSNFLHGEQGALLAASQILLAAPDLEAKKYAAAQVYDEARHVEAYDRYLTEKIQLRYPPSPHLTKLLDTILTDNRWDFKFLGMQILVEGLALGSFGMILETTQEPLIKAILLKIMQDEARHVAFGMMTLRNTYRTMPASELRDREDFVIIGSRLLRDRFLGQEIWDRIGLPAKECEAATMESATMQLFRSMLFSKIVPNVKRLGLLTPYVRKAYAELGILHYEDMEASA